MAAWRRLRCCGCCRRRQQFFSSLFSSEITAPISLKFGMELPWVEDYHFSSLHVFQPIREVT